MKFEIKTDYLSAPEPGQKGIRVALVAEVKASIPGEKPKELIAGMLSWSYREEDILQELKSGTRSRAGLIARTKAEFKYEKSRDIDHLENISSPQRTAEMVKIVKLEIENVITELSERIKN